MHRYDPHRQKLAIGLAFLAGQVDAAGFLIAGGYFTSFMSGNTTRLGVDLAVRPITALLPLGIIACFVAGVVGGALVARRFRNDRARDGADDGAGGRAEDRGNAGQGPGAGRHKQILLALVTALLALAAWAQAGGHDLPFLAAAATAMGIANNVFSRDGEVTVGVTYMTGALVRFGQGLAARIMGHPVDAMRGYGLLWAALACGAASGAWLYGIESAVAVWAAVIVAAILTAFAFWIEREPDDGRISP